MYHKVEKYVTKEVLHILDNRKLSCHARLTYIVMASCIKNNVCLESLDEISRKASMSNKSALAATRELISSRFITKQMEGVYSFSYLRGSV